MTRSFFFLTLLGISIVLSACQQPTRTITFSSLLKEMVHREQLPRYPDPYYDTGQFSSYDRRAERRGGPNWFANLDRTYFLRTEQHQDRTEYVMMDTTGPGAITRFWMTFAGPGAGQGTLRIYLDHSEKPVIEGKAFDVLSGGQLTGTPLSGSVSPQTDYKQRGHNLYLPIPYREHIKITYQSEHINKAGAPSGGEAVYYNINYRTYEPETRVRTFTHKQLQSNDSLLQSVQQRLSEMNHNRYLKSTDVTSTDIDTSIASGSSVSRTLDGSAAIRHMGFTVTADDRPQALRSTVLEMKFDDRTTVWTPIGDFFGTGYRIRPHTTWYTKIGEDGQMHAYWIMPFQSTARITIHNVGGQNVNLEGQIDVSDWQWSNRSMHFGASWRQDSDVDTGERKSPDGSGGPFDIDYTHLKGQGVYIGDMLTLYNTAYAWWGEGDEKIYVDGEQFPSHFGTGTEDYYGYAWAKPADFTRHPFISQPDGSGNLEPGYTVNLRYRSLDAIPFQNELEVDMELWHWVSTRIDYAVTTFFYTRPGTEILIAPDTTGARKKVALFRTDIISPAIENNRIEGEQMALDTVTGGSINYQNLDVPGWSQNKQLWWLNGNPGDRLSVYFTSDESGTYQLTGRFTRAHDYGRVRMWINGQRAVDFNGYSDTLTTTTVDLGQHTIQQGKNTLTVELEDYSPEEEKAFWGLDYIDFNKAASP